MIIKGRCRGNGAQMATYLVDTRENDRAEILAIHGSATPNDLKRSLLQMSLTSEITGRTKNGLYHCQLSPRIEEAQTMTPEQKLRMIEILSDHLGMPDGQKWVLSEQEKDGRIHFHIAYQRYNEETGTMWDDDKNYQKHKAASRAMEKEFEWKLTYDKTNRLDRDTKDYILQIWDKSSDPGSFIERMGKAGFEVTQGIDKRPYQFVDEHGTVFDLARHLDGVKQREVSERLNPIRKELRPTTDACKELRLEADLKREIEEKSKVSDKSNKLSDSQELASAMLDYAKNLQKEHDNRALSDKSTEKSDTESKQIPYMDKPFSGYSVSYVIKPSPSPKPEQKQPEKSDKSNELSDSQNLAAAMIRKQQEEAQGQKNKVQEAKTTARQQTEQKYYLPSGREVTKEHYDRYQASIEQFNKEKEEKMRNFRDYDFGPDR